MREFLLHRIWREQRLLPLSLITTSGESLQVLDAGTANTGSGPDFYLARIRINNQLWSGHVELHISASDWYVHRHHLDVRYNTVILHVVWSADTEVKRKDGTKIPTLDLSRYLSTGDILKAPESSSPSGSRSILCSSHLRTVPHHLVHSWIEELYQERIEQKSAEILQWTGRSSHFWDHVFFKALLKGFGLNRNGEAFASLSDAIPFQVLRRVCRDLAAMESLLFGLSGLLDQAGEAGDYTSTLKREYNFLKTKFKLNSDGCQHPEFFSLRPSNFPTIRLSQLAVLYHKRPDIFEQVRMATTLNDVRALLKTETSPYWHTHYTFGASCTPVSRKTTIRFTDLLILNSVIPVLLAFSRKTGKTGTAEYLHWAREINAEDNRVVRLFRREGIRAKNARESQALLELYKRYCRKNKCLQCRWGTYLLYGKC